MDILPIGVRVSPLFEEISDAQVKEIIRRMNHIEEVVDTIQDWIADGGRSNQQFLEFLDDLELDVATVQNLDFQDQTRINSWLIHSTWVGYMDRAPASGVPDEIRGILNDPVPEVGAQRQRIENWLARQADGLRLCLDGFARSTSLNESVTTLLSLDVILAGLLFGLYRSRIR